MPSASTAKRLQLCPPSHKASKPFQQKETAEATAGTNQHSYMEWLATGKGEPVELTGGQLEACREAERQKIEIMDFVFDGWADDPPEFFDEERMWYTGGRFSGVPDVLAIRRGEALIIDYKFGRVKVDDAKDNIQLRWLSVLVDKHYRPSEITVCIVQPACGGFTMHTYSRDDVRKLRRKVLDTLRKIEGDKGRFKAGEEQCRYCPARVACPEVSKKIEGMSRISKVEALSPAQMSKALDMIPMVESACRAIKARATEMLKQDANSIKNYELKRAAGRRKVSDTSKAYHTLLGEGIISSPFEFLDIASVPVGKLQGLIQESHGCGHDSARKILNYMLSGNLIEQEGEEKPCRVE